MFRFQERVKILWSTVSVLITKIRFSIGQFVISWQVCFCVCICHLIIVWFFLCIGVSNTGSNVLRVSFTGFSLKYLSVCRSNNKFIGQAVVVLSFGQLWEANLVIVKRGRFSDLMNWSWLCRLLNWWRLFIWFFLVIEVNTGNCWAVFQTDGNVFVLLEVRNAVKNPERDTTIQNIHTLVKMSFRSCHC